MVDVTLKKLLGQGQVRHWLAGCMICRSTALSSTPSPDIDVILKAVRRRFRWRIVPSGAHARQPSWA